MRTNRSLRTLAVVGLPGLGVAGCAVRSAPSLILFGAYFPGWLLCALIGVAGAAAARLLMVALTLQQVIPYQFFVCAACGAILAALTWLAWFGR